MVKAGKISAKINGLRPWIPRSQSGSAEGAATGLRMPEVDQRDIGTCEDAGVDGGCNPIRGARPPLSRYRNGSAFHARP